MSASKLALRADDVRGRNFHILVIRPGALGDTVVTEPAVASLRAAHPQAAIELAGRTEYLTLLVGPGLADGCISTDSVAFTSLFSDGPSELPESDVVLAYLPDTDGTLESKLRAPSRKAVVFDPRPKGRGSVHIVDHLLAALHQLEVPAVRDRPRIECRDKWSIDARAACPLCAEGVEYAVIHPGTGGRSKLWQAEKWGAVMSALAPLSFVLTCGPADSEVVHDVLEQVTGRVKVEVVNGQPVTTIAGVIAGARFFLGLDSGVAHLAAALGIPAVVIFGPTNPDVWAPRGASVQVLRASDMRTASVAVPEVLAAVRSL